MPRPKGTPKTGGRAKGTPNRFSGELKDMILQALGNAGGVDYLTTQAKESPTAFLSLVGKVLPLKVGSDGDGLKVTVTWKQP